MFYCLAIILLQIKKDEKEEKQVETIYYDEPNFQKFRKFGELLGKYSYYRRNQKSLLYANSGRGVGKGPKSTPCKRGRLIICSDNK